MADDTAPFDRNDPELASNPRRMFKLLRDHAPVMNVGEGPRPGTLVSRYEDVLEVLRNPAIFSSSDEFLDIGQKRPLIPLQLDPPELVAERERQVISERTARAMQAAKARG